MFAEEIRVSRNTAVVLSVLFPGLGQMASGQKRKGGALFLGELVSLIVAVDGHESYNTRRGVYETSRRRVRSPASGGQPRGGGGQVAASGGSERRPGQPAWPPADLRVCGGRDLRLESGGYPVLAIARCDGCARGRPPAAGVVGSRRRRHGDRDIEEVLTSGGWRRIVLRNKEMATAGSSPRRIGHLNVWHLLLFGMLSAGLAFCSKQHKAPVAFHETLLGSPSDLRALVEEGNRVVLTWRMADDTNVAGFCRLVVRYSGTSEGGPRDGDGLRHRRVQFDR